MCRNITMLRGLEPVATTEEMRAAALQYARKVSGVTSGPLLQTPEFLDAVEAIAAATARLRSELPPRKSPPPVEPPMRRIAKRSA
jgi:hypothetical protein